MTGDFKYMVTLQVYLYARAMYNLCTRAAHCSLLVVGVTIRYTTLPRGLAYTPILRSFITMALDPVPVYPAPCPSSGLTSAASTVPAKQMYCC